MLLVPMLWATSTASASRIAAAGLVCSGSRDLPGEPMASEQIWMPFSSAARRKAAWVFWIAQRRRLPVGRVLHAHLDAVEPDLARERDLGDVAALPQVPVGHPDAHGQRVDRLPSSGTGPSACAWAIAGTAADAMAGLLHEIPPGHRHADLPSLSVQNFRMSSQPLRYSGLLMNGAASGAFRARRFW